ncbi:MAG: diguanylate cyclase [Pseudomonadales bacterium]|nr:diguanylate cyclase [Pseudomonadales bacterium]
MRILIVDDTATIREIASAHIVECGHVPMKASSGLEAIEILKKDIPEFIFMDVEMPGLDGFETTRQLREILKDDWIPIIFLTGLDSDEQYNKGIDSGGDDYLTKPINPIIFRAKIKAMERIIGMKNCLNQLNEQLARTSITDGLTGLTNRRGFEAHADKCWKQCQRDQNPVSLIMIDIDHFKLYNDNYGHQEGDSCLVEVSNAIQSRIKRPMDLAARYGGEEFVVILPNTELEDAKVITESIRQEIENLKIAHFNSTTSNYVTLSLGVSTCLNTAEHRLHDLIKCADKALYLSKEKGRNQVNGEVLKQRKKVMVIDDEEENLSLLSMVLENHFNVLLLQDAAHYLDEVHSYDPDLILLDIKMPSISGYDVCAGLRKDSKTRHIPIILVSSLDKTDVRQKSKKAGASGYIQKPVNDKQVLAKINSFLD